MKNNTRVLSILLLLAVASFAFAGPFTLFGEDENQARRLLSPTDVVALPSISGDVEIQGGLEIGSTLGVGGTSFLAAVQANDYAIGGTSVITGGRAAQNLTALTVDNLTLDGSSVSNAAGDMSVAPAGMLLVNGASTAVARIRSSSSSNLAALGLFHGGTEKWTLYAPGSSNDLRLYSGAAGADRLTLTSAGNVTASGTVTGGALVADNLTVDGSTIANGSGDLSLSTGGALIVYRAASTAPSIYVGKTGDSTARFGFNVANAPVITMFSTLLDFDTGNSTEVADNESFRFGRATNTTGSLTTVWYVGSNSPTAYAQLDHKTGHFYTFGGIQFGSGTFSGGFGAGGPILTSGIGTPEGSVVGRPGSIYSDTSGGGVYRKASGTGNTGWVSM